MNARIQDRVAPQFRLLINGQLVAGASTFDVINPATEQVLATCPRADAAQLDAAVAAAKAAFPAWSARSHADRRRLLNALADGLAARSDEFARLLTSEQGKPLAHAAGEIAGAVEMIRTFAAMDLPVKVLRETSSQRIVQHRTPLGVVAAITPWNFPMILLMARWRRHCSPETPSSQNRRRRRRSRHCCLPRSVHKCCRRAPST
jgi:acyl-CoA reductase-like NAD-dependent aldehyde dehydrogenase